MFDYLQKFKKLPRRLQNIVDSPYAIKTISMLEDKYGIDLAPLVIKIMVKQIPFATLEFYLRDEFKIDIERAVKIKQDLLKKLFYKILDYLQGDKIKDKIKKDLSSKADNLKKTKKQASQDVNKEIDLSRRAEQFLIKIERVFNSKLKPILRQRLLNIIKTYERGVRNKLDTKLALEKSQEYGGLGFTKEVADNIVDILSGGGKVIKPVNFAKQIKEQVNQANKNFKEIYPPTPAIIIKHKKPLVIERNKKKQEVVKPEITIKSEFKTNKNNIINRKGDNKINQAFKVWQRNRALQGKIKMEDIKSPVKLIGPIEELKLMDLKSFRRLSNIPYQAKERIKEKINLLSEEDFSKKIQGIKAFRNSPLNKIYLAIGNKSMESGKPIDEVIGARIKKGIPTLTKEEFRVIMELNKSLRF